MNLRPLLLASATALSLLAACSQEQPATTAPPAAETPMERAEDLAPGTTIKGADGSKIVKQADGDIKVKDANGNVVKRDADDGTVKMKSEDGTKTVIK
ncbi:hypothetical protein [Hymenobacter rubripertinctus]|uniref:Uncharacterized protein n=1 Tax=Hymenobacter rubripertinctus TaxID=2029981 RepID=A0A418R2G6_9BACT|nr:hypothetical protein [Hymenobacter rubripertinctus]RIY11579.1 hypothetical protein D0T11_07155 [Hymenobacter rubripertinctus]